jgi:catechol 2,3-dioxygenase-like lactoylglutathione lyase family enzyme
VKHTDLFHVGLLVMDIDAAIERFTEVLGLTFNPPTMVAVDLGNEGPLELPVSYSQEGPPHIELIEMTGDGVFSSAQGEGFHHIGLYVPDMAESLASREQPMGVAIDDTFLTESKTMQTWYSAPESVHGVRLEFVDKARRPIIERWIAGSDTNLG